MPKDCPRVLINLERAGDIGSRANDVVLLGKADDVVRKICAELGWADDLEALWKATALVPEEAEEDANKESDQPAPASESKDDILAREVEKLTKEVENTLKISEEHHEKVSQELKSDTEEGVEQIKKSKEGKKSEGKAPVGPSVPSPTKDKTNL